MKEGLNSDPKPDLTYDEEKERGSIQTIIFSSLIKLKERYGVDDLSTIESVRLRDIAKEVLKDGLKYLQSVQDDEITGRSMFDLSDETIARWLFYLYGYKLSDIPSTYIVDGYHECENIFEVDSKIEELKRKGKKEFTIEAFPTEEFKHYFKKVREESHQP